MVEDARAKIGNADLPGDAQYQADATMRSARVSAAASIVAALFAAASTGLGIYSNVRTETDKLEQELILHAAAGDSILAYCNVKLWKSARMISDARADAIINAFEIQRPHVKGKSCDV